MTNISFTLNRKWRRQSSVIDTRAETCDDNPKKLHRIQFRNSTDILHTR